MKYYYPSNISICNEGCEYTDVDYELQRFICECNAFNNETNNEEEEINEQKEEYEQSYLDYFLSLINYKIITCNNLFFEFSSFYYNAGFYISFSTLLVCMILMMAFWILGIKKIKVIFYKNEDANAFFSIGIVYSKKNNSKMAIKCYKKAIEYNYSDYLLLHKKW